MAANVQHRKDATPTTSSIDVRGRDVTAIPQQSLYENSLRCVGLPPLQNLGREDGPQRSPPTGSLPTLKCQTLLAIPLVLTVQPTPKFISAMETSIAISRMLLIYIAVAAAVSVFPIVGSMFDSTGR